MLITNFRDSSSETPNKEFNLETSKLFIRFFTIDTISGISDGYDATTLAPSKVIRYAQDVVLTVELDPEN